MNRSDNVSGSNQPMLIVAWLFVGIPLLWGVIDTLKNALKLFT